MSIRDNSAAVLIAMRAACLARLERGARILTNHAKRNMGVSAVSGKHKGRSRKRGKQVETKDMGWKFVGNRKTFEEFTPSAPGEHPRRRTGFLRMNVTFEAEGLEARYGTNVPYGRHLETGTASMAPRPWMTLTNAACLPQLQRILGGNIGLAVEGAAE